jgi:hypothetical protein
MVARLNRDHNEQERERVVSKKKKKKNSALLHKANQNWTVSHHTLIKPSKHNSYPRWSSAAHQSHAAHIACVVILRWHAIVGFLNKQEQRLELLQELVKAEATTPTDIDDCKCSVRTAVCAECVDLVNSGL